jgi:hypothetical protein
MKKLKQFVAIAAAVLALSLGGKALAQPQGGFGGGAGGGIDFQNMDAQQRQAMMEQFQGMSPLQMQGLMQQFQNMDPQQRQDAIQQFQNMDPEQMQKAIQERVNNSLREQFGVTNDTEWTLIEERITAVNKARAAMVAYGGGMMGFGGMRGGFGGGRGGGGGGGFLGSSGQSSPEQQALQQAIDSDAPAAQIEDLLAKFQAARKEKQAALAKAQDDLRSVLTTRQEGIAVLGGLLD